MTDKHEIVPGGADKRGAKDLPGGADEPGAKDKLAAKDLPGAGAVPESSAKPEVITNNAEARERWNDLDSQNVARSAFTNYEVLVALSDAYDWKLSWVFWGRDMAASFFVRTRGWAQGIVVPPFSPYSAVCLASCVPDAKRKDVLNQLFLEVPGLPTARLIALDPRLESLPGAPASFRKSTKQTYLIPTAPFQSAMSSYSEGTRRLVKRSLDSYTFQRELTSTKALCAMVSDGYEAHSKRPPLRESRMTVLADQISQFPFSHRVSILDNSSAKIEAGIILLTSENTAWYWMAGSVRGPAMSVLLTYVIDYLHQNGIHYLDLMGANTQGITEFKRRFGGELVAYSHLERSDLSNKLMSITGRFKRLIRL